jgi:hypothetical protein
VLDDGPEPEAPARVLLAGLAAVVVLGGLAALGGDGRERLLPVRDGVDRVVQAHLQLPDPGVGDGVCGGRLRSARVTTPTTPPCRPTR